MIISPEEKIFEQLKIAGKQNIVFWGASLFLTKFLEIHKLNEYNILGIIDNNSLKWGKELNGYKIFPPLKLLEFKPIYVIFTIENNSFMIYQQVQKQIKIFSCPEICLLPNIFQKTQKNLINNNHIYLIKNGTKEDVNYIDGLNVIFNGENNVIEINVDTLPQFNNCTITMNNNNHIKISSSTYNICNLKIIMECQNSELSIGQNFWIQSGVIILDDNLKIKIGDNCLFSNNIYLRASDGHTIIDTTTNEILNFPDKESIIIGNHVWLTNGVSVLKNSKISANSIVGKSAIVNKKFNEENVILAGIPAKIVKKNINWDYRNIIDYQKSLQPID